MSPSGINIAKLKRDIQKQWDPLNNIMNLAFIKNNPDFGKLWISQLISNFGDWFYHVGIIVLLYRLTGSAGSIGIFIVLRYLPRIFINSFSGYVIDHYNKRTILVLSDLLRAVIIIALCFAGSSKMVPLLYVLVFLHNALSGFFKPTLIAIVPKVIRNEKDIVSANAMLAFSYYFTMVFATALGGLCLKFFSINAVLALDAVTFLISVYFIILIPSRKFIMASSELPAKKGGYLNNYRIVFQNKEIFKSIFYYSFWQLAFGMNQVLLSVYIVFVLMRSDDWIGYTHSTVGVGSVIGALLAKKYFSRILYNQFLANKVIIGGSLVCGIFFCLLYTSNNIFLFQMFILVVAIIMNPVEVILESMLVKSSPDAVKGQMSSLLMFSMQCCMVLGALLCVFLLRYTDERFSGLFLSFLIAFTPIAYWFIRLFFKKYEMPTMIGDMKQ